MSHLVGVGGVASSYGLDGSLDVGRKGGASLSRVERNA